MVNFSLSNEEKYQQQSNRRTYRHFATARLKVS